MTALSLYGRDIADLLAPQGARRQPMPGFDADYADIVDYIIRCTHRIWEQKDIGLIETHYGPDCLLHTPTGPIQGVGGVIAGTLRTLGGFPDRTLIGDAVIWSDEGEGAYLSSHRITSRATNLGPSEFGPATGRAVTFTTVADCLCRANRIVEEWLVRDNSAIALQLGYAPLVIAQTQAQADRQAGGPAPWRVAAIEAVRAGPITRFPDAPLPDPHADAQGFANGFIDAVLDHRRLGLVRELYAVNARFQGPGARRLFGHGEITGWWAALLGSFGDARVQLDHVAAVDGAGGLEIAVRWQLAGHHDGAMLYGAATGRAVWIMAISHWRIQAGRIVEEWLLMDDIAVLRQIEGGL